MRTPLICGNWKMNLAPEAARTLVGKLVANWDDSFNATEVAVCPPFVSIPAALDMASNSRLQIGAQNCHHDVKGAYTGEVSSLMLAEMGLSYVILGHSERRTLFGETDGVVSRKAKAVVVAGLRTIVCVGETDEQRQWDETEVVLKRQIVGSLHEISMEEMERVVIAYEPVWAIGTGKTATPALANDAHRIIRSKIERLYSTTVAEQTRILYGGSMKAENARELLAEPEIDGGLIGGASLEWDQFLKIVAAAS